MSHVESFEFNNWTVEVHRKPRHSIKIMLTAHRPIKVIAAVGTPYEIIEGFLLAKKEWIEKNFARFEALPKPIEKRFSHNETFPFFGHELKFKPVITLNKRKFVSATEQNLLLHIPRDQWSASVLVQDHPDALKEIRVFYKREAMRVLTEKVRYWSGLMGVEPRQLRFREQRTRWGSCSSKGFINLNWRLVIFKKEVSDYVVVHELAHLKHMDHSARFWGFVEKFQPDYKDWIKELRKNQHLCEFLGSKD